jgi:oligopeptide transport system substrate-binding protein
VRQALARAIDRERLVAAVGGQALPAWALVPPGMPGHIAEPAIGEGQRFDARLALESLRGTRFEGGRNWPEIVLTLREEGFNARPLAEALLAMLRQHLGMEARLRVLEARAFADRVASLEPQLALTRWSAGHADPHDAYGQFHPDRPGGRRLAWQVEGFGSLLNQARIERDPARRLALYRQAETILQQAVAYIPLCWPLTHTLVKPWVRGMEQTRAGYLAAPNTLYTREARALTISTGA